MILPPQPNPDSDSFLPPDINLVIVVGTAFHDIVPKLVLNPLLLVIVVDVQHELDKLTFSGTVRHRVVLLPVGNHKTVQQLVDEHGTRDQQAALRELPAMSTSDGLAQLACGGVAGVEELLSRTQVQQRLYELVPRMIQLSGGRMPRLQTKMLCGVAGGMASQGAGVLMDGLGKILWKCGVMSLDVVIHLIGGISFSGPGFERTQQNSACSLVSWLKRLRSRTELSVTYSVYAFEALPVGNRRTLRSQLIADEQSAFYAPEVQNHIRQVRSNHAADGMLGNIAVIETQNFNSVSMDQICNDVAAEYLPDLETLMQTSPAFSQIVGLSFHYEDARQQPSPAEHVVDQILEVCDEDALRDLIDPGESFVAVELKTEMLDGSRLPMDRLTEHFAQVPTTLQALERRLSLLMGIHERCTADLHDAEELAQELDLSLDDAAETFLTAHQKAVSPPRLSWKSRSRHIDELCDSIDHFRTCISAVRELEEEIHLLNKGLEECRRLIDQHLERLSNLIQSLKQNVKYTEHVSRRPIVTARPLEQTFAALYAASLNHSGCELVLAETLRQCVASVTRVGLQTIVGAADDSIDAIVAAVQSGHAAVSGPAWGGQSVPTDPTSFIVYPSISTEDRCLLEVAHRESGTHQHVAFARPTVPSLNVVQLKLTYCRELTDFLTPYYQSGLRKVVNDPASALFLSDISVLSDVGIEIETHPDSESTPRKVSK